LKIFWKNTKFFDTNKHIEIVYRFFSKTNLIFNRVEEYNEMLYSISSSILGMFFVFKEKAVLNDFLVSLENRPPKLGSVSRDLERRC